LWRWQPWLFAKSVFIEGMKLKCPLHALLPLETPKQSPWRGKKPFPCQQASPGRMSEFLTSLSWNLHPTRRRPHRPAPTPKARVPAQLRKPQGNRTCARERTFPGSKESARGRREKSSGKATAPRMDGFWGASVQDVPSGLRNWSPCNPFCR
jgi:hypothetical protein